MIHILLLLTAVLICFPTGASVFAQEFQRETDTIPVIINGLPVHSPFVGGLIGKAVFADIDSDGDLDLFIGSGNHGTIVFFRNNGTATASIFTLEEFLGEEFPGIDSFLGESGLAFADIDNDGDLDLFIGHRESIWFYRNIGTAVNFNFSLETTGFAGHTSLTSLYFTFADIDDDGDLDLFATKWEQRPDQNPPWDLTIDSYRNLGTPTNPDFSQERTERFAGVVIGWSFCVPSFADIDEDGDLDLFVGGELQKDNGGFRFYRNIGSATSADFTLVTETFGPKTGMEWLGPAFGDIDDDGDLDLVATSLTNQKPGARSWVRIYKNAGSATEPDFPLITETFGMRISGAAPTVADIDNDGDLDLFVGERLGNINFFRNDGTAGDPILTLESEQFLGIDVGRNAIPTFADIDNDGDLDLFVGEENGNINFYRNMGTASEANFTFETASFASIIVNSFSSPTFADIDGDGDLDLFIGKNDFGIQGDIHFYRNIGTASEANFSLESENFVDVGAIPHPTFADIDRDGDLDLFVTGVLIKPPMPNTEMFQFFRNIGTFSEPNFVLETSEFASIKLSTAISLADIDNDGDLDLFAGGNVGLSFYRNVMPTSVSSPEVMQLPETFELSQNYPNPFNPETIIRFQLPKASHIVVKIYNTVGQPIRTVAAGQYEAGIHTISWDGKDNHGKVVSSGVYFYKLQAENNFTQVRKMSLLR